MARCWRWSEVFEGLLMLPVMGGGVKAGVACGVLAFWGCMPEDAGYEFAGLEREVLALGVAVIEVGECHLVLGEMQAAIRAEGAALDVAGQVERDTAPVCVGFVDLDIPVGAPLLVEQMLPVRAILLWWQGETVVL